MKTTILSFILLSSVLAASAQTLCDQVFAVTDRQCYMAGELLCVRIDAFKNDTLPSDSRVAYVELSDQQQMVTQAMVSLENGQGWAELELPMKMHSGAYQLTAYTADMLHYGSETYFRSLVGVVNGEQLSRRDKIRFLPLSRFSLAEDASTRFLGRRLFNPSEEITIQLSDSDLVGCAVSVERVSLASHMALGELSTPSSTQVNPVGRMEREGHIVRGEVIGDSALDVAHTRLALIGRSPTLYDGQRQPDGSFLYYTTDIHGTLPTLVNGYSEEGEAVPMKLSSPYAKRLSASLPELIVYCDEAELLARATAARRQAAVNEYLHMDTTTHTADFYRTRPEFFYDLDEYTSMNSIREILLEFVQGVSRRKHHGVNMLYTINPGNRKYSDSPALVLLDGMPVYDIDEILDYDSHLIKYVQVYTGKYFFGSSCCHGVISFITRGGRLSNYKLDAGSHLISYGFPQDHPVYENHTGDFRSTLLWKPCVTARELTFLAPPLSGRYLITIQGVDRQRKPYRHTAEFFVK